jgi:hypothetical protein
MVESEFVGRKKIGPAVRGKSGVGGRQDGKEVVFPCSDGPFSAVGLGGNVLDFFEVVAGVGVRKRSDYPVGYE